MAMPLTGNKALFLFLVLISGSTIAIIDFVYADEINPGLYSTESVPFGTSFGDWTAAWWQWVHNVPPDQNVNFDKTGEFCHIGQEGPVWFLGPSFGGKYERSLCYPGR